MPQAKSKAKAKAKAKTATKKTLPFLNRPDIFVTPSTKTKAVPIHVVREAEYESWLKKQPEHCGPILKAQNFSGKPGTVGMTYLPGGKLGYIAVGAAKDLSLYTLPNVVDALRRTVSESLRDQDFEIVTDLTAEEKALACTGWALACYQFTLYKKGTAKLPRLIWPKGVDKNRVEAFVQAISLVRNLINLPANALGPEELADAAKEVATRKQAKIAITEDKTLLAKNFPMIYAVGDGSERRPRLIDITWGNPKDPKVTIVGKGVVFDTGGYDIKPSAGMLLMKKDMGGAAMALGLAWMVASLKLPVRLRVLIPAVENSISGKAYRPMDILQSRKGSTVEIHNTDAEGRLVMADCLTLACEENPDLLVDFSTLTGAARTALGFDIPAMFSNRDEIAEELKKLSFKSEDPLWQLPLWDGYRSEMYSNNADMNNTGTSPAGAITAALFLEHFVTPKTNWIHIDHYAWEHYGRPGRPKGGTDMGLRAILALLEKRYATKKKTK